MKKNTSHQRNKYLWRVTSMSPANRRMKLIYILLIPALLTACKVKKDLSMKTESLTEKTEQKDLKQSEQVQTETTANRDTEKETVTEGVTITYDTEKPADPQTGKPPVKSETTWKQQAKEKAKEESAHTGKKDTQSEDKSRIDTKQENHNKLDDNTKKDIFHIPWGWIALCLGLAATLLITLKYKKR